MDDDERVTIRERHEDLGQLDHAGGVLLGLIVALFTAAVGLCAVA